MHFSTNTEILALVLTVVVHVLAAGVLIWAMIDHDDPDRGSWRDWWPRDDRGDDGPPAPPEPDPQGGMAFPVLPDAGPPAVRPRRARPARVGDLTPRPERRPSHVPAPSPAPAREPAGDAD